MHVFSSWELYLRASHRSGCTVGCVAEVCVEWQLFAEKSGFCCVWRTSLLPHQPAQVSASGSDGPTVQQKVVLLWSLRSPQPQEDISCCPFAISFPSFHISATLFSLSHCEADLHHFLQPDDSSPLVRNSTVCGRSLVFYIIYVHVFFSADSRTGACTFFRRLFRPATLDDAALAPVPHAFLLNHPS